MKQAWLPNTYMLPKRCDAHGGSDCPFDGELDEWRTDDAFRLEHSARMLEPLAEVAHNKFGARFDEIVARASAGLELAPRGAPFPLAFALFDDRIDGVPPALAVLRRSSKGWCASAWLAHLAMRRARLSCWQLVKEMFGCWWLADPFMRGRAYPVPHGVRDLPPEWQVGSFVLARVTNVDRSGYLLGAHSMLDHERGRIVLNRAWTLAGRQRPSASLLLEVWQAAQMSTPSNTLPC